MQATIVLNRIVAATVATALVATMPVEAAGTSSAARRAPARPAKAARVGSLPPGTQRPTTEVLLSTGQGEVITLPADAADVWVANPNVADVDVSNPRQIRLFGKDYGETTVFVTAASGRVIYSTNVRVAQNLTSIDRMMKAAMPDADIKVITVGQLAILTGTVAAPADVAQAQQIVTALLNPGIDVSNATTPLKIGVINRLRTATPLQVNLQVKIAEVSKSFAKNIGSNLSTIDGTGGFKFGISNGRSIATTATTDPNLPLSVGLGTVTGYTIDPITGKIVQSPGTAIQPGPQTTTIGGLGKLFGLDILGALDLGETDGQVTTLANPNLTALSGETGSFLAGGEIPIPVSQGLGAVSVEYKQYGVSLAYTPTVLADGRISMRVRPEVSQLSAAGAVQIGGVTIPALTTRRAETTIELGSGQSMVIGGLLQNSTDNQITKTPGIGDVPVLGALFRSNGWKRNESELIIVITPYLVKPVNADQIVLPTDGYKAPTDLGRVFLGRLGEGTNGGERPKPTMAVPTVAGPAIGASAPVPATPTTPQPNSDPATADKKALLPKKSKKGDQPATPGFSL
ncbi:type II and III secretion system protein family protein [Sphingomonas pruni]|uniref:type II and III secretion system protein family protein n=1 Tax=Sphingomonas pruni TaxID=40683 RepID=UPI000836ED30|nr:type II and III secretion system protein family protein [Sphingomonas pruni]